MKDWEEKKNQKKRRREKRELKKKKERGPKRGTPETGLKIDFFTYELSLERPKEN